MFILSAQSLAPREYCILLVECLDKGRVLQAGFRGCIDNMCILNKQLVQGELREDKAIYFRCVYKNV